MLLWGCFSHFTPFLRIPSTVPDGAAAIMRAVRTMRVAPKILHVGHAPAVSFLPLLHSRALAFARLQPLIGCMCICVVARLECSQRHPWWAASAVKDGFALLLSL